MGCLISKTTPNDLDDLRERIRMEVKKLTPNMLLKVRRELCYRLGVFPDVYGEYVEHFISYLDAIVHISLTV